MINALLHSFLDVVEAALDRFEKYIVQEEKRLDAEEAAWMAESQAGDPRCDTADS